MPIIFDALQGRLRSIPQSALDNGGAFFDTLNSECAYIPDSVVGVNGVYLDYITGRLSYLPTGASSIDNCFILTEDGCPILTEDGCNLVWECYENVYESFAAYGATTDVPTGTLNSGKGWAGPWVNAALRFNIEDPGIETITPFQDLERYPNSAAVVGTNAQAERVLDTSSWEVENITNIGGTDQVWGDGKKVYLSYLMKSDTEYATWGFGLKRANDDWSFFLGMETDTSDVPPNQLEYRNLDTQALTAIPALGDFQPNKTHFVVVEMTQSLSGDTIRVFYNPDPTSMGVPGTADLTYSGAGQTTRFNKVEMFATDAGNALRIDEIRIGTTWNAVTPTFSEEQYSAADVDAALWLAFYDPASLTVVGNQIEGADDKSGNDNHYSQTTPALKATYDYNADTMIATAGQKLEITDVNKALNLLTADGAHVTMIVMEVIDPAGLSANLLPLFEIESTNGAASHRPQILYTRDNDTLGHNYGADEEAVIASISGSTGMSLVTGITDDAGNNTIYLNTVSQGTLAVTLQSDLTVLSSALGDLASSDAVIRIKEVVHVSGTLDNDTIEKLESSVMWRNGIQSSIPGAHAYSSLPPKKGIEPFVMSVDSTVGGSHTLRLNNSYNYSFDYTYGDLSGTHTTNADLVLTPTVAGVYDLTITPHDTQSFPAVMYNNQAGADQVLEVKKWGTGSWYSMEGAFYGCSSMDITATDKPDTRNVSNWDDGFRASGITKMPAPSGVFTYAVGTSFAGTWLDCTSLLSFAPIDVAGALSLPATWKNCSSMIYFGGIKNSSNVTNFFEAWRGCSSLTSFPLIDTSGAIGLQSTWQGCSGLTSFPLIDTSGVTNFFSTWHTCSGLTSFPLIDTSSGANMASTWVNCSSLTSFPLIDTSSATAMTACWFNCSGLTSFPAIDVSNVGSVDNTWRACSSLTSFPALSFTNATSMSLTWFGCSGLTSFPLITNTSGILDFGSAWQGCSGLTSFPLIDTSGAQDFTATWSGCVGLTTFPLLNTSNVTGIDTAWNGCSGIANFPAIDMAAVTTAVSAYNNCGTFTSFGPKRWDALADGEFMFLAATIPTADYDTILTNFDAYNSNSNFDLEFGGSKYTSGGAVETARTNILNRPVNLTDGGAV